MPPRIDLRRYNITDQDTALEFLALIVNKIPQIERVFKKMQLENQSLKNHNQFISDENKKLSNQPDNTPVGDNISVSDRLAGKTFSTPESTQAQRLAQMAAAGSTGANPPEDVDQLPEITTDSTLLPKPPSAPGEIGTLNLPPVGVVDTITVPELPPTGPELTPLSDAPEDGVSTDDIELDLSGPAPVLPATPPAVAPNPADTVPVGEKVAKAQLNEKELKKLNRPKLNEFATSIGIADVESFASNGTIRKAILAKQAENVA